MSEQSKTVRSSRLRTLASRSIIPIGLACLALCLAGICVRLTVRDHLPIVSLVYYAVPPVVAAGLAFVAGALFLAAKRKRNALAAIVTGLLCLPWWYQTAYFHHAVAAKGAADRILFWNVCRGKLGWDSLAEEIRRTNAAVVGLVEAGRDRKHIPRVWERRCPEHRVIALAGGMTVLFQRGKGEISSYADGPLGKGGRYGQVDLSLDGKRLTIVLVDIKSRLLMSRREPLQALTRLVAGLEDRPVIIMGDFNTPTDSVHLVGLRRRTINAFESAGTGFYATWPVPLPVLALDQVWVNDRVQIESCRFGWSWRSDHRPVITEVTVRD